MEILLIRSFYMFSNSFKRITLAFFCSLTAAQNLHCFEPQDLWDELKETGKTIGLVSALTGCTYLIGRGSASVLHSLASSRFNGELYLTNHKFLFTDEEQFKKLIKESILNHHAVNYSTCSVFRNYPYVKFKEDLDWYIPRLWAMQLFCIGSDLRTEIHTMVHQLIQLRRLLVSDYEFIKERRRFEEGSF